MGLGWTLVGLLWCVTIVGIRWGCSALSLQALPFSHLARWCCTGAARLRFLMNILWLLFGGLPLAVSSAIHGLIFCVTIVGIPFGLQCFKMARLALAPFGADVAVARYA